MSLIACTSNYSNSILVGDILMTSDLVNETMKLPTFLNGIDKLLPFNQQGFPLKLRQKIYIVNDRLCVGLAGFETEMKAFLEDISGNFKYRDCTLDNLKTFLKEYHFKDFDSSVFVLFAEASGNDYLLHSYTVGKWNNIESPVFENVHACGSGSAYFLKIASENVLFGTTTGDHLKNCISQNYVLLTRLLGIEKFSLDTIKMNWGAGFEMIYFNGDHFSKMDDITFMIWRGYVDLESDTNKYDVEPFLILKYKYYDDILFIQSLNGNNIEAFAVLPIYKKKDDVDFSVFPKLFDFNSRRVCCSYVLELSNGKTSSPSFFAENDTYPGILNITFNEIGQLQVMVQSEVQDLLIQNLKDLVAAHKIR